MMSFFYNPVTVAIKMGAELNFDCPLCNSKNTHKEYDQFSKCEDCECLFDILDKYWDGNRNSYVFTVLEKKEFEEME